MDNSGKATRNFSRPSYKSFSTADQFLAEGQRLLDLYSSNDLVIVDETGLEWRESFAASESRIYLAEVCSRISWSAAARSSLLEVGLLG
jgi:hypothetical protein